MHIKVYAPLKTLIVVALILSVSQLSCRLIPTNRTNPEPPANELHPPNPEAKPEQQSADPSQVPEGQEVLDTKWKLMDQIGGNSYAISTLPGTPYALVGVGPRIMLLDTNPLPGTKGKAVERITQMWQSGILPGVVRSICIANQYAYVAAGKGHVQIFDVADPLNIQWVSEIDDYGWAMSVVASGNRLFIADNNQGLWVADISDPEKPRALVSDSLKISAVGLAYQNPYLYLVDIAGQLNIFQLIDSAGFSAVSQMTLPQLSTDIVLDGDYAYISAGTGGLWVVDISDPTEPKKVAERSSAMADGIIKVNDYIYLTDYTQGLFTFDISRPTDPQLVNTNGVSIFNQGVPGKRGLSSTNNTLLIANPNEGAIFFDLSTPETPRISSKFVAALSGAAFDLDRSDSLIYVTRDYLGLGILSLDPPEPYYLVSQQPTFFDGSPIRSTWKQAVAGNHLYQADMNRGLVVIDIADPAKTAEVERIALPQSWSNVTISDNLLIGTTVNTSPNREGSDDLRTLRILDLSKPGKPKLISFLKMDYNAQEVAVSGNYIFYPDSLVQEEQAKNAEPRLRVIDFSNPNQLVQVAEVDTSQTCPVVTAAQISESILYLGDNSRGICVFDVSNPLSPVFVDRVQGIAPVRDLAIGDQTLFAAIWSSGAVLDLQDPLHPQLTENILTPGLPNGVSIHPDGSLFIADTDGGVVWYTEQN